MITTAFLVLKFLVDKNSPPIFDSIDIYSESALSLTNPQNNTFIYLDAFSVDGSSFDQAKKTIIVLLKQLPEWEWAINHLKNM